MIFVIDVGNSRIKWGFAEGGELIAHGGDIYPSRLSAFASAHWLGHGVPTEVVISNVGKHSLGDRIRQWIVRQWKKEPFFITSQAECLGVTNAYLEPSQLGSDRWAALIAARHLTQSPALIIGCGSAITIDVIDRSGTHLGGLITPGLDMMRNALVVNADRIKLSEEDALAPTFLARDTKGAVMGGTLYTAVAAIDRITRDVLKELGSSADCFITGGDALQFLKLLAGRYKHRPNMVLEGLVLLAKGEA